MPITLNGTTGIAGVDGSAGTPAIQGGDSNTGMFFPAADTVAVTTGGSERLRVDSAGNVGIGTVSPTSRIQANNTINTVYGSSNTLASGVIAYIRNDSITNATAATLRFDAVGSASVAAASISAVHTGDAASALTIGTRANSGSDVTERARIDSGGNLLVGKTQNNDTSVGCVILPTDANTGRFKATGDNGTAGASFQVTNTSGSSTFIVRPNGNVVNTNNSYGSISDIKLKENIVDATPKLDKLNQVRVVNYNLIGDQKKQIGVVAQELEQIFPSMIEESPDEDGDGNRLTSTTKAVKYSVFVPMLIKALQEQQVTITALEARITALETAQ